MTDPDTIRSRFVGAVVGQALGDAMGFALEGRPGDETLAGRAVTELASHPSGAFPVGQYTDDTQMARAILLSLVERGCVDEADIARKFASLWAEGTIVGRGIACTEAAERIIAGVSWKQSGAEAGRAGNGAAMRAAPLGLYLHAAEPAELRAKVVSTSRITHTDPRAQAGAVAVAAAVASNVTAESIDREHLCGLLVEHTGAVDAGFATHMERLPRWLDAAEEDALAEIRCAGLAAGAQPDWPGISPFVIPTVLVSLYAFMRTPSDWREAVRFVIAAGGDVDTTGAITGAIAGAFLGEGALPQDLARQVNDRSEDDYGVLVDLAHRLFELVSPHGCIS